MPNPSPITKFSEQELLAMAFNESADPVSGKPTGAFIVEESASQYSRYAAKTITVPAATTNYDVADLNPTLFNEPYKSLTVYAKDAAISIRLYTNTEDEIDLDAGEQQTFTNANIDAMFITTTVESTVRIIGWA